MWLHPTIYWLSYNYGSFNDRFFFPLQGYGEQAIFVLDRLADEALRATVFKWGRPEPPVETGDEEGAAEDEAELNLDKVEEEMAANYSDEEEDEDILHINELTAMGGRPNSTNAAAAAAAAAQRPEEILQVGYDKNH